MTADMTVDFDSEAFGRITGLPKVCKAATAGAQLVALWPLTDAKYMDNDSKYVENLQVRLTRTMAAVMTGEDVTLADAEFVYEGADDIPGRPRTVVEALLAANEAYDAIADYSETADAELVAHAADILEVGWGASLRRTILGVIEDAVPAIDRVDDRVDAGADSQAATGAHPGIGISTASTGDVDAKTAPRAGAQTQAETIDGEESVVRRFSAVLATCDALFTVIAQSVDAAGSRIGSAAVDRPAGDAHADGAQSATRRFAVFALPVVLYANELSERLAIPRFFVTEQDCIAIASIYAPATDSPQTAGNALEHNGNIAIGIDDPGSTLARLAAILAPLAQQEWNKHREDMLWDPDDAKRQAKEEDERKSKEALAAKFAHVKP